MDAIVNERVKEILSDAARWGKEALSEWGEAVSEYPIPHVFSVLLGAVLITVARWFL